MCKAGALEVYLTFSECRLIGLAGSWNLSSTSGQSRVTKTKDSIECLRHEDSHFDCRLPFLDAAAT